MLPSFSSSRLAAVAALVLSVAACSRAPQPALAPTATVATAATPAAPAPVAAATPSADDAALAEGRRWTTAFYDGQTEPMWDRCSDDLRKVLGSKEKLDAFRASVLGQLGAESKVLDERIERRGVDSVYVRTAQFDRGPGPVRVAFQFDAEHRIVLFLIRPA